MSGFGCVSLFLLPFMVVSVGVFGFLGVKPLWQSLASQRWLEVPCTIDQAEVQSSRDSDGDQTSRIVVSYTYRVDGRNTTVTGMDSRLVAQTLPLKRNRHEFRN